MKEHPKAHILRAIADGYREFEYRYLPVKESKWCSACLESILSYIESKNYELRIKPATIKIGDVEVNAPLRVAPPKGSEFWALSIGGDPSVGTWDDDDSWCHRVLRQGRMFVMREDAIAVSNAIVKLLGGEV